MTEPVVGQAGAGDRHLLGQELDADRPEIGEEPAEDRGRGATAATEVEQAGAGEHFLNHVPEQTVAEVGRDVGPIFVAAQLVAEVIGANQGL